MEKRERGEIRVHERADGQLTFSLRFRVDGRRRSLTLGKDTDGWTWRKAERKLDDVLAQVRAGVWKPPAPPDEDPDPIFHVFASRWWAARKTELRPNTQLDYDWRLKKHLLPFFADYLVSEIDVALVDRYREEKVIERDSLRMAAAARGGKPLRSERNQPRVPLSNESINKTLVMLANVLDDAVDRGLLESNPARGKRRRLKVRRPTRKSLERDELKELLAVAKERDHRARQDQRIGRRPMIGLMAKSGIRVTELCQLRWRDVDVHHKRLVIRDAKTDAGVREVDLTLDLMEELIAWRAEQQPAGLDDYVFATKSGRPRDKDNVRERVLAPVVEQLNEKRAEDGIPALPKLTPHALRRTYISLMLEAGAPLHYVMAQVGHEDAKTTLEIYAQVQKRLSRKGAQHAFDALLQDGEDAAELPAGRRAKIRSRAARAGAGRARNRPSRRSAGKRGPR
jgi:integrase